MIPQRTLLVAGALLALASSAAGAPNPAATTAPSQSPYRQAIVDDLRAQFLDVYAAAVPADNPQRELTLDMLDAAILRMADAPNERSTSRLAREASALDREKKLGAMGRWLAGYFFHEHQIHDRASELLLKSINHLVGEKSTFPWIIKARLVSVVGDTCMRSDRLDAGVQAWDLTVRALTESFKTGEFEGVDERVAFFRIKSLIFESGTMEFYDGMKAVVEEHIESEWLKQMSLGEIEHARAWKIRTRGRVDEVDPNALGPFHEHVMQASLHFQAAYAAAPDRPEAPAMLIGTSKMGLTPMGTGPRYWFDIAVRNEFDYLPAYRAYIMAIVPRWGGSVAALDAFADECMATDRYDTRVPAMAYTAWWEIWMESGEPGHRDATVWTAQGRYEKAKKLFEQYKRRGNANQRQTRLSEEMCIAWFAGDMETVEELLELLGDNRDQDVLNAVGLGVEDIARWLEERRNAAPPPE